MVKLLSQTAVIGRNHRKLKRYRKNAYRAGLKRRRQKYWMRKARRLSEGILWRAYERIGRARFNRGCFEKVGINRCWERVVLND